MPVTHAVNVRSRELYGPMILARAGSDRLLARYALEALDEAMAAHDRPSAIVGAAMRAARLRIGTTPDPRKGIRADLAAPAAEASQSDYNGHADHGYVMTARDLRQEALADAIDAIVADLNGKEPEVVGEAVDTLEPLMEAILRADRDEARRMAARPEHYALAEGYAGTALAKTLKRHGIGFGDGSKTKGMKPGKTTPTSGPASHAVILGDPGSGHCWIDYGDHYERVTFTKALQALFTLDRKRYAAKTARAEARWDTILDYKRPVKVPGRNSGKQKGRMGGSAIISHGR